MILAACIAAGTALDFIFGDPARIPHPITYIGKLISFCDKRLYGENHTLMRGAAMTVAVCAVSFLIPFAALFFARRISVYIYAALETFWIFQILACKSLYTESMKVYYAMKTDGLDAAREKLSYIVGRDTKNLSEQEVIAAAVETVAENAGDGVTAPMLFIGIGGAAAGFLYKSVNTLDSMVGYKTERYMLFGRPSAYLDDAANFIPSRICAVLMIFACFLCGLDAKGAARIFKRDRLNHSSPNSAQTEAVIAGALGVQLGGTHSYFGKPVVKPSIGDNTRHIEWEDLRRANRVMVTTSVLSALLTCGARMLVLGVFL